MSEYEVESLVLSRGSENQVQSHVDLGDIVEGLGLMKNYVARFRGRLTEKET
jgi:hypothetical protein